MNPNSSKSGGWAVVALIVDPGGRIPLVRDGQKDDPKWKFPGGTKDPEDKVPLDTCLREIKEEVGLTLSLSSCKLAVEEPRRNHMFYFYLVEVENFEGLLQRGDEGEDVKVSTFDQILEMVQWNEFFFGHEKILRKLKLIK